MNNIEKIFKYINQVKKKLEEKNYNVLYIGLYGSQNYGLTDEQSDIDLKAIVLPSLDALVKKQKINLELEMEKGLVQVKDLWTYYEQARKGNMAFLEPMHTDYYIGDKKLRELFCQIPINLTGLQGMMEQKQKAFKHPYPSKIELINKFGYDPKQLLHIIRLYDLWLALTEGKIPNTKPFINYQRKKDLKKSKMHNILQLQDFIRVDKILNKIKRNTDFIIDLSETTYQDKPISLIDFKDIITTLVKRENIKSNYKYQQANIENEILDYMHTMLKIDMFNNSTIHSAKQFRTFGNPIPKKDLQEFKELQKYNGKDITYIIYKTLSIL